MSVGFHELTDKQESVDSSDALGNNVGNHLALGRILGWNEKRMPKRTDLVAFLLNASG